MVDASTGREHHGALYFDDGSIVLSAPLTTGGFMLYRVHRTILAKHSPVFADMFTMPPPSDIELYDGVPIIHMPDRAEDLASLLTCIYEPRQFHEMAMDTASSVVRGAMRLAIKYSIDYIHDYIAHGVRQLWPMELCEWDEDDKVTEQWHEEHEKALQSDGDGKVGGEYFDDRMYEPASAVRFAREFDMPEILPPAFYELAYIGPTDDYYVCRGNLEDVGEYSPTQVLRMGRRTARWSLLTHTDFLCLIQGQNYLNQRFPFATKRAVSRFMHPDCTTPPVCRQVRKYLMEKVGFATPNPLGMVRRLFDEKHLKEMGFCYNCSARLNADVELTRKDLWGALTPIFDVER